MGPGHCFIARARPASAAPDRTEDDPAGRLDEGRTESAEVPPDRCDHESKCPHSRPCTADGSRPCLRNNSGERIAGVAGSIRDRSRSGASSTEESSIPVRRTGSSTVSRSDPGSVGLPSFVSLAPEVEMMRPSVRRSTSMDVMVECSRDLDAASPRSATHRPSTPCASCWSGPIGRTGTSSPPPAVATPH